MACSADSTRRGDLADRVAGARADGLEAVRGVLEQGQEGHQAGGHDERLGDRGVLDGVRVGGGAVGDEVHPGDGREPGHAVPESGELQPGVEESRGLGALSGRDDNQHALHSAPFRGARKVSGTDEI
jgi:hypothetical protein